MTIFDFIHFFRIMPKKISVAGFLLFGALCFLCGLSNGQSELEKQRIMNSGPGELQKLYEKLKTEKPDKDVEIHYLQQTIIKEPQEKDEYLTHLVGELRKALQKGKKQGTVRRVEGKLVEIDKGAVHKIHERDVYLVYDSSGRYKSKMEVEAVADAVSIGTSYEQKKTIEPGDTVKFRGQRKLLELGLIYGFSEKRENYSGLGMIWKYNLRSGWGFDFLGTYFTRAQASFSLLENYREKVTIPLSLGARKYIYYPFWISPYVGLGGSYLKAEYEYKLQDNNYIVLEDIQGSTIKLIPYFAIGTQLSGNQFQVNLEARYFHGPKLNVRPEPIKIRPIIYSASISFAW